jgi:hypothetical protein
MTHNNKLIISPFTSMTFMYMCLFSRNSKWTKKEIYFFLVFFLKTFYALFDLLVMQLKHRCYIIDIYYFKKIGFQIRTKYDRLFQVLLFMRKHGGLNIHEYC